MNPPEALPSQLSPLLRRIGGRAPEPPVPATGRSPAADRSASPLAGDLRPVASGRQPAGTPRAPLQASFRFHELARQIVVTLIRPETQDVICQIPPEKILNLIVYLRHVVGAAFDKRA